MNSGILEMILVNLSQSNTEFMEAAVDAFLEAINVPGFDSNPNITSACLNSLISLKNVIIANNGLLFLVLFSLLIKY